MSTKRIIMLMAPLMAAAMIFAVSCSNDESNPASSNDNPNGMGITLSEYGLLVAEIAPPVYGGGITGKFSKVAMDSMWKYGECPLLGKVFGDNEPMSLYWNVDMLDMTIEEINQILTNDTVSGVEGDSLPPAKIMVGLDSAYGAEILELTSLTQVPVACQSVLGFSHIDLDYVVKVSNASDTSYGFDAGFKVTDSSESYFTFFKRYDNEKNGGAIESFIFYAYRNLTTDAIELIGLTYIDNLDETHDGWIYKINSLNDSDFVYRMSWYSFEFGDADGLGCIIGGGNKDDEFVLSYREHKPANDPNPAEGMSTVQMFGPDYSDMGTQIATEYEGFINTSNFLTFDDFPAAILTSPWAD